MNNSNKVFHIAIIIIIIIIIQIIPYLTFAQQAVDSGFVRWNEMTLSSLVYQANNSTKAKQKALCENRIRAFKAYWGINDVNKVNTGSARYAFLQKMLALDSGRGQTRYILEANESGYVLTERNFIIYQDSANRAHISLYQFKENRWEEIGKETFSDFFVNDSLRNYSVVDYRDAFNRDDLIITRFENGTITDCAFFLEYSLSKNSPFREIIGRWYKIGVK